VGRNRLPYSRAGAGEITGAQRSAPRIGIDMHSLSNIHQGVRTHCLELFSRAVHLGSDFRFFVFVAEPDRLIEANALFTSPNVDIVQMSDQIPPVRLLAQLPILARKYRLDLLHTQYIIPPFCPCPAAVTVHDTLFESHPQFFPLFFRLRSRLLVRFSARNSALVFSISQFSRREIVQRYDVDEDHVATIANGVNLARFYPGKQDEDAVAALGLVPGAYILTVGRLEPRKNHAGLLRGYSRLAVPRPKLAIVGQPDFRYSEISGLIRSLRLEDDVVLLDKVDDCLLPAIYRHALLFVYPSWAEGFGLPILEAMASGVPVATSGTTALLEIAGDAALFVRPEDPESIAAAMKKVIADAQLRHDLAQRGQASAALFTWERAASQLVDAYRSFFNLNSDEKPAAKRE
jgi:glycosyltransferase involved in cell wall biosynthesis